MIDRIAQISELLLDEFKKNQKLKEKYTELEQQKPGVPEFTFEPGLFDPMHFLELLKIHPELLQSVDDKHLLRELKEFSEHLGDQDMENHLDKRIRQISFGFSKPSPF